MSELAVLSRALELRRLGRLGCLWAEGGKYYVSPMGPAGECDPHGSRERVSLEELAGMVARAEGG